jgi:hypothetical protein
MFAVALAVLLAGGRIARAEIGVDLELVLAVDSSGSVDFQEFALQARGIAQAFRDPEVIDAIEGGAPNGIAISVIQWSGRRQHLVTIDWTRITDATSANALAARIDAMGRVLIGETAIADALRFAHDQLASGPFQGTRQIIDLSGDGMTNAGGDPDPVRDTAALAGITINGLAIINEIPSLDRYYAEHVIGGTDAFVMAAKDYDDFVHAIRHKLLREIRGAPLADAGPEIGHAARAAQRAIASAPTP